MLLALVVLSGCGKPQQFTLSGELDNLRDRGVTAIWYDGSAMQSMPLMIAEGKNYRFQGNANRPVAITLMLSDGSVAGTVILSNGDNVKLKADADAPWLGEVTGSKSTAALYAFMAEHSGDPVSELNELIAQYVNSHLESPESSVLMTFFFHVPGNESRADSLIRAIKPQARPASLTAGFQQMLGRQLSADAVNQLSSMNFVDAEGEARRFAPSMHSYSLLAIVADNKRQIDSLDRAINSLPELPKRRFHVLELSTAPDSTNWALSIRGDSVARDRVWAPAILADARMQKLAVPDVPFFILVDSVGNQLIRTRSVSAAMKELRKHIR